MKYIKKIAYIIIPIISFLAFFNFVQASIFSDGKTENPYCSGDECSLEKGIEQVKNSGIKDIFLEGTASGWIQNIIIYILYFLRLAAIIIIIYAGFNMLTAGGDEEKFNKSKNIIIYAIIGLAIIFLAGPITSFIINIFVKS